MANFSKVADEVFQILRSFDYTVDMFDGDNERVIEPEDARRFFAKPHNILVSVIDDDDDSRINLFYGKSTHANDIIGLNTALRETANKYALIYRAQQYNKEIEPKDIANIISSIVENKQDKTMNELFEKAPPGEKAEHFIKKHKAEFKKRYGKRGTEVLYATAWKKFGESVSYDVPLVEGMYGTSRSSYLKMENAKMIVRHSRKIDEKLLGARGRCIESIFIENAVGERHLFPSKALAPARAMTQHVNKGGSFQDQLGEHIIHMSENYSHLGSMSRHVKRHGAELHEGAGTVLEACTKKMKNLRKTFECLAKEQTYAKESSEILEKANMLSEKDMVIDETRLSELRQMLNDADLPKEVYECAARAMDECKDEPMVEENPINTAIKRPNSGLPGQGVVESADFPSNKRVHILGHRVDASAWDKFKKGELDLRRPEQPLQFPKFKTRFAELCYKLSEIASLAMDHSLANLLFDVKNKLEDHLEHGTMSQSRADNAPSENFRNNTLQNLLKIAKHAVKASGIQGNELAENNKVVKQYMDWIDQFDTMKVLQEDQWTINNDYENFAHEAENYAIENFLPEEFIDSEEFKHDIGSSHNADDPEENKLTRDEIMGTLKVFLRKFLERHFTTNGDAYNADVTDIARTVYDKTADVLRSHGYIIEDELGSLEESGTELDMEDIMIPKDDMGDGLAGEVTKKVVHNPDHPNDVELPNNDYIGRIQTLAGIRNGQNY